MTDVVEHLSGYQVIRLPRSQDQINDWLDVAARRHTMHALLEVDVTDARRAIRERRARVDEPLSLTAFIVACLAQAIVEDKHMHAHRKGKRALVLFDDVDVTVAVERSIEGAKIPVPCIVRAANRKSPEVITREIRDALAKPERYRSVRRLLPLWLLVPAPVRRLVWTRLLADPIRRKRITGTTFVTAVGMFGHGVAWGVPEAQNYTLGLTVGGIARRPGVVRTGEGRERIEVREVLCLTLSFDHELIEGAPAARFAGRLKELIEHGSGVVEAAPAIQGMPVGGMP